ncbi:hypothetical protein QTP88_023213 [Uroleucon formosanum]
MEFKFEMYDLVNGDIDNVGLSNMLSAASSGSMLLTKESYFLAGFKMPGDHSRGLISSNKNNKLFSKTTGFLFPKQKEAEAKELATQSEKSKSKWFNVKNEQKINSLEDGASEILNEGLQIEIDSGCSQVEQTSNTNELSFQGIPVKLDKNILIDHDLSHGIAEKQSLVDEETSAKMIEGTSNTNEFSFQGIPVVLDKNILVDHDLSHGIVEKQSLVDEEINVLKPSEIIFNNPQAWPTINDKLRCILVQHGPERGQLEHKPFKNHWFYKELPNGESVERSWMMYSQPNDAIFCFYCILFGKQFTALSDPKRGFSSWKKMERLKEHEDSQDHINNFLEWKMLENKVMKGGGIDDSLQKEIKSEQEKWRHVLKIILDVLLCCANNNLALRGNSEEIDEFISLLSKKVREKIINQIKSAKYFTIMFDCTPDVSKREQMSQVIRYVHISNGQAYDNEANMAGKYKGVQAKIMEKNSLTTFIPCFAHSLNLAGVNAASSNVQMNNFFSKIQQLFNFFSGSPSRWEELKSLKLTLKPFSDTRWSSKSVAIKAVFTQLPRTKSLLLFIDYEFICLLSFWNAILSSIDRVNVCLQSKSLTIKKAANLIKGLINEITDLRNNRLQTLFQSAEELTKKMGIATVFPQKRIKRVKLLDLEESTDDWNTNSKKSCIINLKNVCDVLTTNMKWRFEKLNQVSSDIGFLNGADLVETDSNYLIKATADLAIKYDNDLKPSDFTSEIINFKNLAIVGDVGASEISLPSRYNNNSSNAPRCRHQYNTYPESINFIM